MKSENISKTYLKIRQIFIFFWEFSRKSNKYNTSNWTLLNLRVQTKITKLWHMESINKVFRNIIRHKSLC